MFSRTADDEDERTWNPFELAYRRHRRIRNQRAEQDPEWAEIEKRRDNGAGCKTFLSDDLTLEDWHRQHEIEKRLKPLPRYLDAYFWAKRQNWLKPREWRAFVKTRYQRARRGYSYRDIWNLDWYLSNVIEKSIIDLRNTSHTYNDDFTEEGWAEALTKMADAFAAHREYHDLEAGDEEALANIKKRWDEGAALFVKYYGSLWD